MSLDMTTTAPASSGYPSWDDSLASLLESTEDYYVEHDADPSDDGRCVVIRRTVWTLRGRKRDIAWIGEVARIPLQLAPRFIGDVAASISR